MIAIAARENTVGSGTSDSKMTEANESAASVAAVCGYKRHVAEILRRILWKCQQNRDCR
jgi:hypothetical protein